MKSPSYQDVVTLRRTIAAQIKELQRLDRALPMCKNDFNNMDVQTLEHAVEDARGFIDYADTTNKEKGK